MKHTTLLWIARSLYLLALGTTSCERRAGSESNADTALPVLAQVPAFSLTNQAGQPFGTEQLRDKPYVAAFMFTRCPSICPRLTATMQSIDELFQKEQVLLDLVSISVDPDHDTPTVLSTYAQQHGANPKRWNFLTGEYAMIARTAETGFKVGLTGKVDQTKPHLGITHASHLILVDGHGAIRGYFRSGDADVATQLLGAVRQL